MRAARLLVSSGVPPYDNASLQAIRELEPVPGPAAGLRPNPREGVTITFLYNIRPEDSTPFDSESTTRRGPSFPDGPLAGDNPGTRNGLNDTGPAGTGLAIIRWL